MRDSISKKNDSLGGQKLLLTNLSSLFLIQVGNFIIPLLITPYLSRVVGIENYGKLEYAKVFILYFTMAIDYGFNLSATRKISINRGNRERINEVVSEVYAAKALLFIVSTFIFLVIIYYDSSYSGIRQLLVFTYLICFGNLLLPLWFFQGKEKMISIAIANISIRAVFLLLTFVFIRNAKEYWMYNLFLSLAQIFVGLYSIYLVFLNYKVRFKKVSFQSIFNTYKEGYHIFVASFFTNLYASFSFILLKQYVTDEQVGAYATALKLVGVFQFILLTPFSQAFFPRITKLADENFVKFKTELKKVGFLLFCVTTIGCILSVLTSSFLIELIFGEQYKDAIPIFNKLIFLVVFSSLTNIFAYQGLLSLKKDNVCLWIYILFFVINVILCYIFIPKYQINAALTIRVGLEALLMLVSFYFFKLVIKKRHVQS